MNVCSCTYVCILKLTEGPRCISVIRFATNAGYSFLFWINWKTSWCPRLQNIQITVKLKHIKQLKAKQTPRAIRRWCTCNATLRVLLCIKTLRGFKKRFMTTASHSSQHRVYWLSDTAFFMFVVTRAFQIMHMRTCSCVLCKWQERKAEYLAISSGLWLNTWLFGGQFWARM